MLDFSGWEIKENDDYFIHNSSCTLNNGVKARLNVFEPKEGNTEDGDSTVVSAVLFEDEAKKVYNYPFVFEKKLDKEQAVLLMESALRFAEESKYPVFTLRDTLQRYGDNLKNGRPVYEKRASETGWDELKPGLFTRRYDFGGCAADFEIEYRGRDDYDLKVYDIEKNLLEVKEEKVWEGSGYRSREDLMKAADETVRFLKENYMPNLGYGEINSVTYLKYFEKEMKNYGRAEKSLSLIGKETLDEKSLKNRMYAFPRAEYTDFIEWDDGGKKMLGDTFNYEKDGKRIYCLAVCGRDKGKHALYYFDGDFNKKDLNLFFKQYREDKKENKKELEKAAVKLRRM